MSGMSDIAIRFVCPFQRIFTLVGANRQIIQPINLRDLKKPRANENMKGESCHFESREQREALEKNVEQESPVKSPSVAIKIAKCVDQNRQVWRSKSLRVSIKIAK